MHPISTRRLRPAGANIQPANADVRAARTAFFAQRAARMTTTNASSSASEPAARADTFVQASTSAVARKPIASKCHISLETPIKNPVRATDGELYDLESLHIWVQHQLSMGMSDPTSPVGRFEISTWVTPVDARTHKPTNAAPIDLSEAQLPANSVPPEG